jgi:hypothetical protein
MVEKYGQFEIDFQEGFVRIEVNDHDYEYIVSKDIFPENHLRVARVFQKGYLAGKRTIRREMREVLGL